MKAGHPRLSVSLSAVWAGGRLTALASTAAGAPDSAAPAGIRGDGRLEKAVSISEKDRPLGEILPELGQRLGVTLRCSRETVDDKVTLFVASRPAGEVLTWIAGHLGFEWLRNGRAYELHQPAESQRREEALRQAELAALQADLDRIAALGDMPRERLQARAADLDRQLSAPDLAGDRRANLEAERRAVQAASRGLPGGPALAIAFARSLTLPQRARLLHERTVRLSTVDGSLSPEFARRIHQVTERIGAQFGARSPREADATARLSEGSLELGMGPWPMDRQLRLLIDLGSLRADLKTEQEVVWNAGLRVGDPAPSSAGPPGAPPPPSDEPALRREIALTLPGPERQPQRLDGGSPTSAALTGTVWPQRARVSDVAEAIHGATGLEVVADSFVGARIDPAPLRGRQPLARTLETLARELNYSWEQDRGVLRLRNRYFYRDRPAEVPERVLRPWRQRAARAGRIGLDDLAELAAALTDPQVRSMGQFWGWYVDARALPSPGPFYVQRQDLRLWASLDPPRRQTAQAQVLRIREMTPPQRAAWLTALRAPTSHDTQRWSPLAGALLDGGFRLRSHQFFERVFVRIRDDGLTESMSVLGREDEVGAEHPPNLAAGFEPHGPPARLDDYLFLYLLHDQKKPLRAESVPVPHPPTRR